MDDWLMGKNEGMSMKKLFYPVVFHKEDEGYSVYVPDLAGCHTQGDTLEQAYEMAFDAIGLYISDLIAENKAIPAASAPNEVPKGPDDFVVLMDFDFEKYSEKYDSRSVKKTLTIPAWLNTVSEQRGVNFSAVLQEALKENLRL